MNLLTEWVKPNGSRIMLNDAEATVEHAESLKWKRFDETEEGLAEASQLLSAREDRAEAAIAAQKERELAEKSQGKLTRNK